MEEISAELQPIFNDILGELKGLALELAAATPEIIANMVLAYAVEELGKRLVTPQLQRAASLAWWDSVNINGTFWPDYVSKMQSTAAERLIQATRESQGLNESVEETAKRMQKALDITPNSARGLAQTALHAAAMHGEMEFFERNRDFIKELEWYAELDRRTCPLCVSLDRKHWKLQNAPIPPIHVRCRCFLHPYWPEYEDRFIKRLDLEEQTRRIARLETDPRTVHHRDGTTSTKYEGYGVRLADRRMTYREWMQSMVESKDPVDQAFAKEALGSTLRSLAPEPLSF